MTSEMRFDQRFDQRFIIRKIWYFPGISRFFMIFSSTERPSQGLVGNWVIPVRALYKRSSSQSAFGAW